MAEFCKCGSIIFNNKCSNKNCDEKNAKSIEQLGTQSVSKSTKTKTSSKNATKNTNATNTTSRRSSKCVTYKLSDFLEKQNNEEDEDED